MNYNRQLIGVTVLAVAGLLAVAILAVGLFWTAWIGAQRGPDSPSDQISDDPMAPSMTDEQAALKAAEAIDPAMIGFHESASFPVGFREPRALAVNADTEIYVGGDRAIARFSPDGKKLVETALDGEPRCLAVGAFDHAFPGRLYVGMENHVECFDPKGVRVAVWGSQGEKAYFTSITTTEKEVWVADAGNCVVWRFDVAGHRLAAVGKADVAHNQPGFLVTNHYFDLAAGTDDLVYVVNPRLLRVEGYTNKGEYERSWGKGSSSVKDFFGCCNPAQLAVLLDGSFVTAEKGIPRVKIYARDGRMDTVVAGPAQLSDTPADLAVDHNGRVLVLDGRLAKVRVFQRNFRKKAEKT